MQKTVTPLSPTRVCPFTRDELALRALGALCFSPMVNPIGGVRGW
jgi:hypothetical protein